MLGGATSNEPIFMHIYFGCQYFSVDASIWQKWRILYFFKNILSDEDMLCKVSRTFLWKARRSICPLLFPRKAAENYWRLSRKRRWWSSVSVISFSLQLYQNELHHRRFAWKKFHNCHTNNCIAFSASIFQNILWICKVSHHIIYQFYSSCNVSFRPLLP